MLIILGDSLQTMDPEYVQEGQKRMKALFQRYVPLRGWIFLLCFIGKYLSCFGPKGYSYAFDYIKKCWNEEKKFQCNSRHQCWFFSYYGMKDLE